MKKFIWIAIAVSLLLGGCAAKKHYSKAMGGTIILYLKMPKAQKVELVTSSNDYKPIKAQREKRGKWSVAVPADGPFDYFYLVDGVPYTPPCLLSRPDGFGGKTCICETEQ